MDAYWSAGSGAFWILGLSWGGCALFHTLTALRLGRSVNSPADGCLLAICNLFYVAIGGFLGFILLKFPYGLLTSLAGAILLPALITLAWIKRGRS
jgi:hypothetical protein